MICGYGQTSHSAVALDVCRRVSCSNTDCRLSCAVSCLYHTRTTGCDDQSRLPLQCISSFVAAIVGVEIHPDHALRSACLQSSLLHQLRCAARVHFARRRMRAQKTIAFPALIAIIDFIDNRGSRIRGRNDSHDQVQPAAATSENVLVGLILLRVLRRSSCPRISS